MSVVDSSKNEITALLDAVLRAPDRQTLEGLVEVLRGRLQTVGTGREIFVNEYLNGVHTAADSVDLLALDSRQHFAFRAGVRYREDTQDEQ